MSSALALAEERERRRIATEIHDNLSQGLALVQIKLDELHGRAASRQQALELEFLVETVEQLNKDARSLMFELSPPILYEFGLLAALEWLADKVQEERGLRVYFVSEGERLDLSEDVSVLTFQVVRELIVNVIKHAKAQNVMIRVSFAGESARIIIEDDGVGRDGLRTENLSAMSGASFGLFSIYERLEDIGARFEIESYVGKGTRAMIELPLNLGFEGDGGNTSEDRDEIKNITG
jgi:signal transduction histidine kinase